MTLQISYNFLVYFKFRHYPKCIGMAGDCGELAAAMWDLNKTNL